MKSFLLLITILVIIDANENVEKIKRKETSVKFASLIKYKDSETPTYPPPTTTGTYPWESTTSYWWTPTSTSRPTAGSTTAYPTPSTSYPWESTTSRYPTGSTTYPWSTTTAGDTDCDRACEGLEDGMFVGECCSTDFCYCSSSFNYHVDCPEGSRFCPSVEDCVRDDTCDSHHSACCDNNSRL